MGADPDLEGGAPDVADPTDSDDALFARLYPALRRLAAAAGPVECDPDDLVQEAVARTLRHHALVDLEHPLAYLRRAIVNLASNARRSQIRQRFALARLVDRSDSPAEYTSDLADLMRLAPVDRALLYLVEVEGQPYSEAAGAVGLSEEAARTRAARARRRLRAGIEGEHS